MPLSNAQTLGFLFPGVIELFERTVNQEGRIEVDGAIKNVKHARDAFFYSCALVIIASIQVALSNENTTHREFTIFVASVGFGSIITILTTFQLYHFTLALQRVNLD